VNELLTDFRGTSVLLDSLVVFQSGRQSNRWLTEGRVTRFLKNFNDENLLEVEVVKISKTDSPWHMAQVGTKVKVKPEMVTVIS